LPRKLIDDLEDPRLEAYRQLRYRNPTWLSGRFVVESRLLVDRLVRSDHKIESLVVDESQLQSLPTGLSDEIQVFIVPSHQIGELIGFNFHRGVLGCGIRKPIIDASQRMALGFHRDWTGVMLVGIQDPENMGLIARTCAALGIDDLFIGAGCVDPYARRVLRVSMGGMLGLTRYKISDIEQALKAFLAKGVQTIATTLADESIPLEDFRRSGPTLIVLGNEAEGLPESVQRACSARMRIDMAVGTDSLNVSVAAGIALHYVVRLAVAKT
jgi:tRNA G18 (ribose-2'-O)-methylase SpoU